MNTGVVQVHMDDRIVIDGTKIGDVAPDGKKKIIQSGVPGFRNRQQPSKQADPDKDTKRDCRPLPTPCQITDVQW